jgi:putative ATPase
MRPASLAEVLGQPEALNSQGPLAQYFIESSPETVLPSVIFHGTPGTGKTSIARLLASAGGRRLIEISAINSSVKELRDAIAFSMEEIEVGNGPAVVFIDEIHRFSKVQQESLLLALETGEIVLIGATTENPSFAMTPAMVSRCFILQLNALSPEDLSQLVLRAASDERGLNRKFAISVEVVNSIANRSGGDARKALAVLESASVTAKNMGLSEITLDLVEQAMPLALARYDATGDQHYDIISAFIKSIRGSDPDAALHWLARMIAGGEDPRFISRRLVILASEDIGLADPSALALANSTLNVVSQIGMPEGRIPLASCTIYLALAPKSNSAYLAINSALKDVQDGFTPEVPEHLRSSGVGRSEYEYPHDLLNIFSAQPYLPEGSVAKQYYLPKLAGYEVTLAERMKRLGELRSND